MQGKTLALGLSGAVAAAALLAASGQPTRAASFCVPAMTGAGFQLRIRVKGEDGRFRLTCQDGELLAVPVEGGGASAPSATSMSDEEQSVTSDAEKAAEAIRGGTDLQQTPKDLQQSGAGGGSGEARSMPSEESSGPASQEPASQEIEQSAENAASELDAGRLQSPPDSLTGANGSGPNGEAGTAGGEQPSAEASSKPVHATGEAAPGGVGLQQSFNRPGKPWSSPSGEDQGGGSSASGATGSTAGGKGDNNGNDMETGRHVAGVSGQNPQMSGSEPERSGSSGSRSSADQGPSGKPGMGRSGSADKPAVAENQAAPDGRPRQAGQPKGGDRLASREDNRPHMVSVPVNVIGNAELALPGVDFASASVEGKGDGRVYVLRGRLPDGRRVAVDVDPGGNILQVDRDIRPGEVPQAVGRIVDALLPHADIRDVKLSNRDNYKTFFVFSGLDGRGRPFKLEIRSDGRSVHFDRPS